MKRKITLIMLVILIAITTAISITYAIWSTTKVADNTNVITSGCLNIEFKAFSEDINIQRTGEKRDVGQYIFTITNTCNITTDYEINLETLEGTTLDKNNMGVDLVVHDLKNFNPSSYDELNDFPIEVISNLENIIQTKVKFKDEENVPTTLDNSIFANNIFTGTIPPSTTYLAGTFLGIDDEDNEAQEKTWLSKIVVNSTPHKKIPVKVNLDPLGGNLDVDNIIVYLGEEYKDIPTPTKEGYVFAGWHIQEEKYPSGVFTPIYSDSTVVTKKEHTLEALWLTKNNEAIFKDNWINDIDLTNIKKILPYKGNPFIEKKLNVNFAQGLESNESSGLIYAFKEDDTLYYYSPSNIVKMTSKITFNSEYLEEIDLSRIDTSEMTDMSYMFVNLINLKSLNLSNWNTTNVTNMSGMFYNCLSLSTLDLSSFDFTNVTNISNMLCRFNGEVIYNHDSLDPSIDDELKNRMCISN